MWNVMRLDSKRNNVRPTSQGKRAFILTVRKDHSWRKCRCPLVESREHLFFYQTDTIRVCAEPMPTFRHPMKFGSKWQIRTNKWLQLTGNISARLQKLLSFETQAGSLVWLMSLFGGSGGAAAAGGSRQRRLKPHKSTNTFCIESLCLRFHSPVLCTGSQRVPSRADDIERINRQWVVTHSSSSDSQQRSEPNPVARTAYDEFESRSCIEADLHSFPL